jgi:hypothetical protein
MNFEGCYTRHLSFKLTHTEKERVAMSNNEKELFPQRVPIILERSSEEKGHAQLKGVRIVAPQDQTLSDIISTVREKANIPTSVEVILMVGE